MIEKNDALNGAMGPFCIDGPVVSCRVIAIAGLSPQREGRGRSLASDRSELPPNGPAK